MPLCIVSTARSTAHYSVRQRQIAPIPTQASTPATASFRSARISPRPSSTQESTLLGRRRRWYDVHDAADWTGGGPLSDASGWLRKILSQCLSVSVIIPPNWIVAMLTYLDRFGQSNATMHAPPLCTDGPHGQQDTGPRARDRDWSPCRARDRRCDFIGEYCLTVWFRWRILLDGVVPLEDIAFR
jgi:hypothetical protein